MARVFVGMSGGVDSSVTAALLVEQGHEVTGVYMKNWTQDMPGMACPWADDVADAKRVAVQLGIDFEVFDFQTEYKQQVVDAMVAEYQAGRTPNPDVLCNQEVKFRLFLDVARQRGAEMIATGHYAQTQDGKLLMAADAVKDQTYFLYRVESSALSQALFPLGGVTKAEVRQLAQERNLWTATKKESMGICFVGQVGIREFLEQYIDLVPGDIVDRKTGLVLAQHESAVLYTIGQRHGLDIGGGLPYYVVDKDINKNIVYVSQDLNDEAMWREVITITDVHWITDAPGSNDELHVRLRHRGQLLPLKSIEVDGLRATLRLEKAERAVAAGQSAVLYRGKEVLGGGIVS